MTPTMAPHAPAPHDRATWRGVLLVVLIDVACSLLLLALVAMATEWADTGLA